jgi:superfamily II DNA or RNA helicase
VECTITESQYQMLRTLASRRDAQSISHCVKGKTLAWFENFCVAYSLIVQRCIISLDTGLGKTLVASGIINIVRNNNPNAKWLFVCQASSLGTITDNLSNYLYSSRICSSNATSMSVYENFIVGEAKFSDVLVVTYEGLRSRVINQYLYLHKKEFTGIVVDESHLISNGSSMTSQLLQGLCNWSKYCIFLTATPLRTGLDQFVNQIYMLDRAMFTGVDLESFCNSYKVFNEKGQVVRYNNLDQLRKLFMFRYVSFTRAEVGLAGKRSPVVLWCKPLPEYKGIRKMEVFSKILGDKDGPALKMLVRAVINEVRRGRKGLIYVNRNDNKEMIKSTFDSLGIKSEIFDGTHTYNEALKGKVQPAFNRGEYDVLITNIATSKDLSCDYICFYELTVDFKQMVGRGERGLAGHDLDIIFILVRGTPEIEYFYDNIYERGLLLQDLCAKDVSELEAAMDEIRSTGFGELANKTNTFS